MQAKERIAVALDVDTAGQALRLVEALRGRVGIFKVGMQLFNSEGPSVVREIQAAGGRVFLDLKFHDIPNTVAGASRVMARLGVHMFNLHVAGGSEMMRQAVAAAVEEAGRCGTRVPYILGVTVLTSISAAQLRQEMKVGMDLEELVVEWAMMARRCGLAGVVASPQEVPAIRQACGPEFLIVTPGVRPRWSASDDQQRVTTPAEALRLGSDYLVIGRPIVQAPDPVAAADRIIAELEGRAC